MAKVAITGSHGFIGQHLVYALEKREDKVIQLTRSLLHNSSLKDTFPKNVDYIFHLAAYGNMSNQKDEDEIVRANINATYNLLKATKNIPYKALINVSSSSVTLPHQTLYSATKLGAEALCKAFVDEYKKPIVTVRPYSVYGPGEADFRFIPTVFRSCLTGEEMQLAPDAVHDWIYIDDVVDELLHVAEIAELNHGFVSEAATGKQTSNQEVVSIIEKITKISANIVKKSQLRAFDSPKWCANRGDGLINGKWDSMISLENGLNRCYQYYKERYAR